MTAAKDQLGEFLRAARIERDLTAATVAKRASLSAPHLSKIETGKVKPNADMLRRLGTALEFGAAEIDELVGLGRLLRKGGHEHDRVHDFQIQETMLDLETGSASVAAVALTPYLPVELQAPTYARSLVRLVGSLRGGDVLASGHAFESEIDTNVAFRLRRAALLHDRRKHFCFLFTEAALSAISLLTEPEARLYQFQQLHSLTKAPNIELRIVRTPTAESVSFVLADHVVGLDLVVDDRLDFSKTTRDQYQRRFDAIRKSCISEASTHLRIEDYLSAAIEGSADAIDLTDKPTDKADA